MQQSTARQSQACSGSQAGSANPAATVDDEQFDHPVQFKTDDDDNDDEDDDVEELSEDEGEENKDDDEQGDETVDGNASVVFKPKVSMDKLIISINNN